MIIEMSRKLLQNFFTNVCKILSEFYNKRMHISCSDSDLLLASDAPKTFMITFCEENFDFKLVTKSIKHFLNCQLSTINPNILNFFQHQPKAPATMPKQKQIYENFLLHSFTHGIRMKIAKCSLCMFMDDDACS